MTQTTDQVLAHRRTLMISFLVGWSAWYGFFILRETGLQVVWGQVVDVIIGLVGMLGWVVFAFAGWRIVRLRKRYKDDPGALAALSDEWMRAQRAKAIAAGFYALLGLQVFLIVFGQSLDWPTGRAAHVSVFVGVAAWVAASLWFEREADESGE